MRIASYEVAANVSLLFTEVPMLERFGAAKEAGFDTVECWWPFSGAGPGSAEVDALLRAVDDAGVRLTGMNFFAGDMAGGERGVLSHPGRVAEFEDSLAVIVDVAERTGCAVFNALYGQRVDGLSGAEQDAVAQQNLITAAAALASRESAIVLEPLSIGENGAYALTTCAEVAAVIEALGDQVPPGSVRLLLDTYHLTNNGQDLTACVADYGRVIGHVQLADSPGRGQPGTGNVDFRALLDALRLHGYAGLLAAEYRPQGATRDTLTWAHDLTAPGNR